MNTAFKQALKAKAHALKPIILIGTKGLTASVINETNTALTDHELIKVKMSGAEKDDKQQMITTICTQLNAELVQLIGHTAIIYRKTDKH